MMLHQWLYAKSKRQVFSLDLKYKEEADLIKNGQVTPESGGVYNSAIYIFS